MGEEQRIAAMGEMLKALLAVAGETLPGFTPLSADSRLPEPVVCQVHRAIVSGAEALGLAAVRGAA